MMVDALWEIAIVFVSTPFVVVVVLEIVVLWGIIIVIVQNVGLKKILKLNKLIKKLRKLKFRRDLLHLKNINGQKLELLRRDLVLERVRLKHKQVLLFKLILSIGLNFKKI